MIVEPFCGLASVSRYLCAGTPAPVSRIGSKRGYAEAIASAVGLEPSKDRRALLMDGDKDLIMALVCEATATETLAPAVRVLDEMTMSNKDVWEFCRDLRSHHSFAWWVWTAGARGGVGGFKGNHKRRPSVDGFIPSLESLANRIENSDLGRYADLVHCVDADPVKSRSYEYGDPELIYFDPPYEGATGYASDYKGSIANLAQRWADAYPGTVVAISERAPIAELVTAGWHAVNITDQRSGQCRRSLTTNHAEWLTVKQ